MEALPLQTDRLRSLARSLLRDAAAADDVVQDAVAAAIARARDGRGLGAAGPGWLRSAVRSLAVDRARSERSRTRRERAVARPGAAPDVAQTVERAEVARGLYDAVLKLPETMRDAVLLRYMDELPPREVAERLGVSVPTAKKRLERGLAKLREDLEAEHGDRGRWAVMLLPLGGPDIGARAVGTGLLFGGAAVAVLAVIGAAAALRPAGDELGREPSSSASTVVQRSTAGILDPELAQVRAKAERDAVPEAGVAGPVPVAAPAAEGESAPPLLKPFQAQIIDVNGVALAGAEFRWTGRQRGHDLREFMGLPVPGPLTLTSRADGLVSSDRVPLAADIAALLTPVSPRLAVVGAGTTPHGTQVCVVSPAVQLAGFVLDPATGKPVPGAQVKTAATLEAITTLDLELIEVWHVRLEFDQNGTTKVPNGTALTDESGRFELARVPSHLDFELEVTSPKNSGLRRYPVPLASDLGLLLEAPPQGRKSRAKAPTPRVFGRVLHQDGSPFEGATVTLNGKRTTTDAVGTFSIIGPGRGAPLIARSGQHQFVVGPVPDAEQARSKAGAGPFDLTLPDAMGSLIGQIVDPRGRPLPGLDVVLVDATSPDGSSWTFERPRKSSPNFSALGAASTDSRGVFGFSPVHSQPYLVRVLDRDTGYAQAYESVLANGPKLTRLVFDPATESRAIRGTVRDVTGRTVPSAQVEVKLLMLAGDASGVNMSVEGVSTSTDANGTFVLEGVPKAHASLVVQHGPRSASGSLWSRPVEELDTEVSITVDRQCELVIRSTRSASEFTGVAYEDAAGATVAVLAKSSGVRMGQRQTKRRKNGSFPLIILPQSTAFLVLLRDIEELERIPLGLNPDERNQIDL